MFITSRKVILEFRCMWIKARLVVERAAVVARAMVYFSNSISEALLARISRRLLPSAIEGKHGPEGNKFLRRDSQIDEYSESFNEFSWLGWRILENTQCGRENANIIIK